MQSRQKRLVSTGKPIDVLDIAYIFGNTLYFRVLIPYTQGEQGRRKRNRCAHLQAVRHDHIQGALPESATRANILRQHKQATVNHLEQEGPEP
jgi:hypothetical protein